MRFIKLRSALQDITIIVNTAHIEQITPPEDLKDQQGRLASEAFPEAKACVKTSTVYLFVKETPDEIYDTLHPNG